MDIEKLKEAMQKIEVVKQNRQQWIENYKKDFEALFEEIEDYINKKIIPELNTLADFANQLIDYDRRFRESIEFQIAYKLTGDVFAHFSIYFSTRFDPIEELCLEAKKPDSIESGTRYTFLDIHPNQTVKLAELLKDARRTYKTNLNQQVKNLYNKILEKCETITDFPEGAY